MAERKSLPDFTTFVDRLFPQGGGGPGPISFLPFPQMQSVQACFETALLAEQAHCGTPHRLQGLALADSPHSHS